MDETPRAGTGQWLSLSVLALPVVLISIDMTVLNFAVPQLSEALRPDATELLWIVDMYGFFLAGLLILMGNLGDRIGRRRLLVIGSVAFGAASAVAAFAPDVRTLIAARALMGLGGATLMPSTLSLIRGLFPHPLDRRTAIACWAGAFAAGAGLGPIVGGFLLEHYWWGSVFLINAPVMLILVIVAPFVLPESRDPSPGRFDLLAAGLWLGTILPIVYGLKEVAIRGIDLVPAAWILAGVLAGVPFVIRQLSLDDPLIDLSLFRSRVFSTAVAANMLGIFALVGMLFYLPQYLQIVRGMHPLISGMWIMPSVLGAVLGAALAPLVARRLPLSWIIATGLLLVGAGYWAGSRLGQHGDLALLVVAGFLIGFGSDLSGTLTNDVIMASAPPEKAGRASGISETTYELGGALGTAILGSVGNAVYAREIRHHLPVAVPREVADAAAQTLGIAQTAAARLPGELGRLVADAAKLAFTEAMMTTLMIAGIFVMAGALVVFMSLRGVASCPDRSGQDVAGRQPGPGQGAEHGDVPGLEQEVAREGAPADRRPQEVAEFEPVAAHQPRVERGELGKGVEDL
jgi:DHA2 family multidrug resistance protein-like MFS transporter